MVIELKKYSDWAPLSVPITCRDLTVARTWCAERCKGDFMIVRGPRILFQPSDDAALATLWWRCGED
jgi:hypothetical protein